MKMLTKKQTQLWLKIFSAVKADEDKFLMHRWLDFGDNFYTGETCGTAACVAGYAYLYSHNKTEEFFSVLSNEQLEEYQSVVSNFGNGCSLRTEALENLGLNDVGMLSEELFSRLGWIPEAIRLYENHKRYNGLLAQVKFLFKKYDLHFHESFCLEKL